MNNFSDLMKKDLIKIRTQRPIIHHITNFVTIEECANICTAIGACPIMAYDIEECEEITSISSSIVLNMGTPSIDKFKTIVKSGIKANELNIPIVFDPVGAGATNFRKNFVKNFLNKVHPNIIKGNVSEIKTIAGIDISNNKGVDSIDNIDDIDIIKKLANNLNCIIAVTGKEDIITNGKKICIIKRGSDMLKFISGSGCMTSTIISSFCAVEYNLFYACIFGILSMDIAGEISQKSLGNNDGIGIFKVRLFDCIYNMYNKSLDLDSEIYIF